MKQPHREAHPSTNIWGGSNPLPFNKWIGMKFLIYNVSGNRAVKMEMYRDMTEGANGGIWEKIGELIDAGGWRPKQANPVCAFAPDYISLTGGGVIILRDTGSDEARYKWFSVREIVPPLP